MPQLAKGGKFIYGWVKINEDLTINIPAQTSKEYSICDADILYLTSGSKSTGGFCIMPRRLLEKSKLANILLENSVLNHCLTGEQTFISYKGKKYAWTVFKDGKVNLKHSTLMEFNCRVGDQLLGIRSSDIAFTLGLTGPLIEHARQYSGRIDIY